MSTPTPVFSGEVDDAGKLHLDDQAQFRAHASTFAGQRVVLTLKKRETQRSLDQNAWIWGVAYPLIAESLGYDRHEHEDLHYGLVAKCFGDHFDKRLGALVPNKRSSKLTTKEFSDYMEWLVRFAAESLDVVVPLPGESEAA